MRCMKLTKKSKNDSLKIQRNVCVCMCASCVCIYVQYIDRDRVRRVAAAAAAATSSASKQNGVGTHSGKTQCCWRCCCCTLLSSHLLCLLSLRLSFSVRFQCSFILIFRVYAFIFEQPHAFTHTWAHSKYWRIHMHQCECINVLS